MTTEKEQLEAEIAERDARIAGLLADVDEWQELAARRADIVFAQNRELAALKAPQPSGVVLPEPLKRGDEGGSGEYGAAMIRGFNACLREVARLNPCRAQTVPEGWVDISERLPEIGRHCLIKIPVCGRHEIEGAMYKGDGVWASAWCSSRGRDCTYKVSHWMAAPSTKKEFGDE